MPEISRFFGIVIKMFHNDHAPPHFHVEYAEHRALVDIQTLSIIGGRLPARARGLVIEWATLHQDELLEDWNLAQARRSLKKIDPLQ